MKKILIVLSFIPLLMMGQERIMVIADPHVMPQSLIATYPNLMTICSTNVRCWI